MKITPAEYEKQLQALEKALGRVSALHVNSAEEISRVRAVIETWFQTLRPSLLIDGVEVERLKTIDVPLSICMGLTVMRSLRSRYVAQIQKTSREFKRHVIVGLATSIKSTPSNYPETVIEEKIRKVHPSLAIGYRQVHLDLSDDRRLSYRGTANELREILRELLEILAPDPKVLARPWYKPVGDRKQPTHQQRARCILESKSVGTSVEAVVQQSLSVVEQGISQLVRDTYSRSAAAAHVSKNIEEIQKLLRHFDALIYDLCP